MPALACWLKGRAVCASEEPRLGFAVLPNGEWSAGLHPAMGCCIYSLDTVALESLAEAKLRLAVSVPETIATEVTTLGSLVFESCVVEYTVLEPSGTAVDEVSLDTTAAEDVEVELCFVLCAVGDATLDVDDFSILKDVDVEETEFLELELEET